LETKKENNYQKDKTVVLSTNMPKATKKKKNTAVKVRSKNKSSTFSMLSITQYEVQDSVHNNFDQRLLCFWGGGVSSVFDHAYERQKQEQIHNALNIIPENCETPFVFSDADDNIGEFGESERSDSDSD